MVTINRIIFSVILVCSMFITPLYGKTFTVGDLYLITTAHPDPDIETGIMRIIPETGSLTTLGEVSIRSGNFSYDPYRDCLLGSTNNSTGGIMMIDLNGVETQLSETLPTPFLIEPRGDGILYGYYNNSGNFGYIDAFNQFHDLLDQSGLQAYNIGNDASPTELQYDFSTNSLLIFAGTNSDMPGCPDQTRSCILKVPLNEEGTQVADEVLAIQVNISTTSELIVGSGHGPSDTVLWAVDTNTSEQEPRMQILDPATMINQTYASNGGYTAAATNAGTFSSRLGKAVILDTYYNYLRAFGYGETGGGTVIATDVSDPGGSGETARLIEIWESPFLTAVDEMPAPHFQIKAYPNPFNPLVTLQIELAEVSKLGISIYDIKGRLVRTLINSDFAKGSHVFIWDGKDTRGNALASGTYFARVTSRGIEETKKLVLIR